MSSTGTTTTQINIQKPKINWGFCDINPVTQVIEFYYNQRKKNG